MFVYKFNKRSGRYEMDTRQFPIVKQQLLFQLTNFGQPIIEVANANHNNRGELLLTHLYEGCLLYTSPSPRDRQKSRMPSSA